MGSEDSPGRTDAATASLDECMDGVNLPLISGDEKKKEVMSSRNEVLSSSGTAETFGAFTVNK